MVHYRSNLIPKKRSFPRYFLLITQIMRKCIYKTRPDFHSPSVKSSVAGGSLQVVLAVRVRVRLFATLQRRPLGVFLEETQSLGVLHFTLLANMPSP